MPVDPSCAKIIDEAVAHFGPRLVHVTAAENVDQIRVQGLWPAAELARRAGIDPATLHLRSERVHVGTARLNHQRPFLLGLKAARQRLKPMAPKDWAAQLDERVFFFPASVRNAFERSFELGTQVLWFDTARLLDVAFDRVDLCALNSGSFRQIPASPAATVYDRDLSIYRPLVDGIPAFRRHRRDKGLRQTLDRVKEVSLRGGLEARTIRDIECAPC